MPAPVFFTPQSRTRSKVLYWLSVPLMAAWAIGWYLYSPFYFMAAGDWPVIVLTGLVNLGPGLLLVLLGMYLSKVRHAECDHCDYRVDVRAPNGFGMR